VYLFNPCYTVIIVGFVSCNAFQEIIKLSMTALTNKLTSKIACFTGQDKLSLFGKK